MKDTKETKETKAEESLRKYHEALDKFEAYLDEWDKKYEEDMGRLDKKYEEDMDRLSRYSLRRLGCLYD